MEPTEVNANRFALVAGGHMTLNAPALLERDQLRELRS
jgi:hypothetical protein